MAVTQSDQAVVAVYPTHILAEQAIQELKTSGYDLKKLSIIGQDYHTEEHVVGFYNMGDRMATWGKTGAFWGGMFGLLFGTGMFLIPGVGPIFVAGPAVGWILGALESAVVVGGLSALGGALFSVGIPKDSVLEYESDIRAGKFVLVAHGLQEEVLKAKGILDANARQFNITALSQKEQLTTV